MKVFAFLTGVTLPLLIGMGISIAGSSHKPAATPPKLFCTVTSYPEHPVCWLPKHVVWLGPKDRYLSFYSGESINLDQQDWDNYLNFAGVQLP